MAKFLALDGNKVILGEPGMGKSELMRELGRHLGVEPVTAIRFIHSKKPATLIVQNKPILIDGLDEAMVQRESDAVDVLLAQLEEADSPPFILSCRSREWQTRNVTTLHQLYRANPQILTLEPFNRTEAHAFLLAQYPNVDADRVLTHLTNHSLEELYGNPLMLTLVGQVAETDTLLPLTQAGLLERVCELIWPEHDSDRPYKGLAELTKEDAFNATGAIAAALLFAGSEAASAAGAAQVQQGDIQLAELAKLPEAKAAQIIFSSKLFHSVGASRAKLVHRVIAEFLGARWLAQQAKTPRLQRRLLAQLHGRSGVPASLRGLHAWLAYHNDEMASSIIDADPYGLLRYGEISALKPSLAEELFQALCNLAGNDPYFRAADWDRKTAAGLMIPKLAPKIKEIIETTTSNPHLRSLFLEGLIETQLAKTLSGTLETIVFSSQYSFSDRYAAAIALLPHRDHAWQQRMIAMLMNEGGNAPLIALELLLKIDNGTSDAQLVDYLFVATEMSLCPLLRNETQRVHIRKYYNVLFGAISASRLIDILNIVTDYTETVFENDHTNADQIRYIVSDLIIRGIDMDIIGSNTASSLWRWLGPIEHRADDRSHRLSGPEEAYKLAAALLTKDALRRALQKHGLDCHRKEKNSREKWGYLQRRLVGLWSQFDDILSALDRLALGDNKDPDLRRDWKYLLYIGRQPSGYSSALRVSPRLQSAAKKFSRGDTLLEDFMRQLDNPEKSAQTIRQESGRAWLDQQFKAAVQKLSADKEGLRKGELPTIYFAAQIYFDHFRNLPRTMPIDQGLAELVGTDLRDDVLAGFEAVLHRDDLPSPAEIASSFVFGKHHIYRRQIIPGLYERLRNNRDIEALSTSLKKSALLLIYSGSYGIYHDKLINDLRTMLEGAIFLTYEDREDFARLWFEPSITSTHARSLPLTLDRDWYWQQVCVPLCAEWLTNFSEISIAVEEGLIDILARHGAVDKLRTIGEVRATSTCHNSASRLLWRSVDIMVRFEAVQEELKGIGVQCPDFIYLLDRRFHSDQLRMLRYMTITQAEWIIREFRSEWDLTGDYWSIANDNKPSSFLSELISWVANDASDEAVEAMDRLIATQSDTYTNLIRHRAAEQRQKRVEEKFSPLMPSGLSKLLKDGPPNNIKDLKTLVLEEMEIAQRKLTGDDLDSVAEFWTDNGVPRDEIRCRDRLAALIGSELYRYGIERITEADMPHTKRVDLVFARGRMQLPVEIKGQWNKDVWDAAISQLDAQYLTEWRSEQHGIYCVLWFGEIQAKTNRRLKLHPEGLDAPQSAEEMRAMLIDRIPEARRAFIDVVVLDFTSGKA
ncbi:NACHT domain-containing protein [Acetobacter senegalensis]|uniref:NACHT domain-containing protein n=1 Tax=Acetobacter senegalensis TaxID=446692 RepID=UPI00128D5119|nr:hypothetical protein [Acetobacter senegalensis]MCG4256748.1 hypothetical protein [Acetobacter senegalensis]MCG4266691.1 hypothetical protein [Acetobacter senegalensis]MPQ73420.1 hypothetical protein [Acetobacter senegalensis]